MKINLSVPVKPKSISVYMHGNNVPPPSGETVLMKVKGYGHPESIELFGLDTRLTKDNFNHVDYYDEVGRWNAVTKFYLDVQDTLPALRDLHETWTQPMENWLIGDTTDGAPPGRPMWWALKDGRRVLRCGSSVFGENVVKVEAHDGMPVEYVLDDVYPEEPSQTRAHPISFYRVIGMRKADVGNVSHQSHPWFVHRCNQANSRPVHNTIDWLPKGETIYYYVLDYSDWMPNTKAAMMLLAKVLFYKNSSDGVVRS